MMRKKRLKEMAFPSITTAIFVTAFKPMQKHFFMTPVCNFRVNVSSLCMTEEIIYTFLAACPSIRYRHCNAVLK